MDAPSDVATRWKAFEALSPRELYALLKLRVDVFVVEQRCAYAELDDRDAGALHLLATRDERLIGYLRLLPPALSPAGRPTLGRIVTAADCRRLGVGGLLVAAGLRRAVADYPGAPVQIAAQAHLTGFYGRFGFSAVSAEYIEDGIPHVDMVCAPRP